MTYYSKSNTSSICKKCEANVKAYGKPTACEYCNIIAAFIGNKCQRCTNSERKYGPAVTCEQCKQRCAFDRHDDSKKVDGKLLCWLCTQSLKRALARTKQHLSSVDKHKHRSHKSKSGHKEKRKSDMMKSMNASDSSLNDSQPLEKKSKMNPMQGELDPNSSDHVVAMTQLKETIASLQKKVQQKDMELLAKDRQITELKAQHLNSTTDLRNEMKNKERLNETKFNLMNTKIQNLLKEVATLSKSARKNNKNTKTILANAENSGSGTDSPSTN
ncbi:protein FAM76A isoform X2 [Manduca sexta]|uniref:protein FAM76A isoform X2 n=1 Tax=Manduca sexta TaxID=7130 RepID=UPI00189076BF|nr:protein FAM76A isoform X2 [Manduca sexta]